MIKSVSTALDALIARGRSPLGPPVRLELPDPTGPYAELATLLAETNGFTVFYTGVQLFRAGPDGLGPALEVWNQPATWKDSYGRLADGLLCFAQDLFGGQFAVDHDHHIVLFDPETADRTVIGQSLEDWAVWVWDDPAVRAAAPLARLWQDTHGPLELDQRLLPRQLFVLGGAYELDNLKAVEAATAMRIRGPIAAQLRDTQDGTNIVLTVAEAPGGDAGGAG